MRKNDGERSTQESRGKIRKKEQENKINKKVFN
jgi:hypothetical protein